jgi:biotin-dependent carboxylase-like uncharacterized protein
MIRVLKKGLYTSIQDLGRVGYRNFGVPISGVMDHDSAILANSILANMENDAVMEITLQGPQLQFLTATKIAITGADLSPTLNGEPITANNSLDIKRNDILDFGKRINGARAYLAIAGGFQTDLALNSRSYCQDITTKKTLDHGDDVSFLSSFAANSKLYRKSIIAPSVINKLELKVHKGPEYDLLNVEQKDRLETQAFTIGLNNRMAYQLEEPLGNQLRSILSSAVLPGTVQLTPSGKMIILMRDCQTTGGYPRIFQLSESAINVLSQKIQDEVISFTWV